MLFRIVSLRSIPLLALPAKAAEISTGSVRVLAPRSMATNFASPKVRSMMKIGSSSRSNLSLPASQRGRASSFQNMSSTATLPLLQASDNPASRRRAGRQ